MTCTLVFFRDTCTLILIGCGLFPAHKLEWAHLPCSGGHYPEGNVRMFRRWGDKRMKGTVEQGAWSGGAKAQHFLLHIPRFAQPIHQTRIAVSSYNPINIYKVVK